MTCHYLTGPNTGSGSLLSVAGDTKAECNVPNVDLRRHTTDALVSKRTLKPIDQHAALEKFSFFFWGVRSNGVDSLFAKCIQEAK